jgi:hypothetical protein
MHPSSIMGAAKATRYPRFAAPVAIVLLSAASIPPAFAETASRAWNPAYTHVCRPVPDGFKIDGILDEPHWKGLDTLVLTRNNGPTGGKPNVETKALTAWSGTRLYVAFIVSSKNVKGTFTRHDDPLYDQDVVELFIDPDGDSKNYLELEWNCLNTSLDYFFAGPGTGRNPDWAPKGMLNAVKVKGTANNASDVDTGMVVEISLPWTDISPWSVKTSFPPKAGDTLPLNFYRIDYPGGNTEELLAWAPTGVANFHLPGKFGALVFSAQPVTSVFPQGRGRREGPAKAFAPGVFPGSGPYPRRADGRMGRNVRLFRFPDRLDTASPR